MKGFHRRRISVQRCRRLKKAGQIEKETLILGDRRVGHRADLFWRARWPALLHENASIIIKFHKRCQDLAPRIPDLPSAESLTPDTKNLCHAAPQGHFF